MHLIILLKIIITRMYAEYKKNQKFEENKFESCLTIVASKPTWNYPWLDLKGSNTHVFENDMLLI